MSGKERDPDLSFFPSVQKLLRRDLILREQDETYRIAVPIFQKLLEDNLRECILVYRHSYLEQERAELDRLWHQRCERATYEVERETIRRLATDIPTLWAAPTTTAADRKEIVRKAR